MKVIGFIVAVVGLHGRSSIEMQGMEGCRLGLWRMESTDSFTFSSFSFHPSSHSLDARQSLRIIRPHTQSAGLGVFADYQQKTAISKPSEPCC